MPKSGFESCPRRPSVRVKTISSREAGGIAPIAQNFLLSKITIRTTRPIKDLILGPGQLPEDRRNLNNDNKK